MNIFPEASRNSCVSILKINHPYDSSNVDLLCSVDRFSFTLAGYTPDSAFVFDWFAKAVVAMLSITAGIGLCTDAWFLLAYSSANADKFKVRLRWLLTR